MDITTKTDYRFEILAGYLPVPEQIVIASNEEWRPEMEAMMSALWHNYLSSVGSVSMPYWSDRFINTKVFVEFTRHLAKAGWTHNIVAPNRNWGEISLREEKLLQFVTTEELTQVRKTFKLDKYLPTHSSVVTNGKNTKILGKVVDSGLNRPGFAKAGLSEYRYDTVAMKKAYSSFKANLVRGMEKMRKEYPADKVFQDPLTYDDMAVEILDTIINNPHRVYNTGNNYNDSRGRAISSVLSKVFNPISSKDARSVIIIVKAKVFTKRMLPYAHRFIAEMLGHKLPTLKGKASRGAKAHKKREFLDLDLTLEHGIKEHHINVWLERTYDALDAWEAGTSESIPVAMESDSSASMLSYFGLILEHKPFLVMTNCLGMKMTDPWGYTDIPRQQFKDGMTPLLYGSGESCQNLWAHRNTAYTAEDIEMFNKELTDGVMAPARALKDFIIENVVPKAVMRVRIWNEVFTIKCNRYKQVGDYITSYSCYDSDSKLVQTINHTHTHKEPDLEQFALFFVTLLIHNLDSQVMDYTTFEIVANGGFSIPLHDANIHDFQDAFSVRHYYAKKMTEVGENAVSIRNNYFKSIGILADTKTKAKWAKVTAHIQPLDDAFVCSLNALK